MNQVKWQQKRSCEKINNPSLRLSNSFMHLEFQSFAPIVHNFVNDTWGFKQKVSISIGMKIIECKVFGFFLVD